MKKIFLKISIDNQTYRDKIHKTQISLRHSINKISKKHLKSITKSLMISMRISNLSKIETIFKLIKLSSKISKWRRSFKESKSSAKTIVLLHNPNLLKSKRNAINFLSNLDLKNTLIETFK